MNIGDYVTVVRGSKETARLSIGRIVSPTTEEFFDKEEQIVKVRHLQEVAIRLLGVDKIIFAHIDDVVKGTHFHTNLATV